MMADKDLHLSNQTIRESGTDQLHLANGVGMLRFATVTEDSAARIPVEYYYFAAQEVDNV